MTLLAIVAAFIVAIPLIFLVLRPIVWVVQVAIKIATYFAIRRNKQLTLARATAEQAENARTETR